jgi:hypothetical protein
MGALPSQRPRPNAILQSWVRCSVRIMTIQFIWAGAYFLLSITRRAVLVGVLLNPVYCITALIGIYGALSLQRCLVAISIYGTILNCMIFLAFVFLNYAGSVRAADDQAWVVLALFLPGLVVDGILGLICLPLLRHLRNAQEAERQAVPCAWPRSLTLCCYPASMSSARSVHQSCVASSALSAAESLRAR